MLAALMPIPNCSRRPMSCLFSSYRNVSSLVFRPEQKAWSPLTSYNSGRVHSQLSRPYI
jgi:hypothetical protein